MSSDRIFDGLKQVLAGQVCRVDPYTAERRRMATLSSEQLKRCWDAYDGTNTPLGFSGEAIHLELNLRGHGRYCAV